MNRPCPTECVRKWARAWLGVSAALDQRCDLTLLPRVVWGLVRHAPCDRTFSRGEIQDHGPYVYLGSPLKLRTL